MHDKAGDGAQSVNVHLSRDAAANGLKAGVYGNDARPVHHHRLRGGERGSFAHAHAHKLSSSTVDGCLQEPVPLALLDHARGLLCQCLELEELSLGPDALGGHATLAHELA
jgi:hypothetical protein